jgi:predicted permease
MIARLAAFVARLAALVRRRRLDRDLDADLQTHFALLVDDLVARGMDPAAARREARLRFGSTTSAREAHRDARGLPLVETFTRDVRYGARLLRRQPGLMAAVVLILAIGIAVPASVLSLLNGFLFRAPVSRDPDAFVRVIRPGRSASPSASLAEYDAFRAQSTSFRALAGWASRDLTAPLGMDDPAPVSGLLVSCNLLPLLGVERPAAGRLFVDDDCRSDVPVAILSESIWRTRYGADPAVVGRTIFYGGIGLTVIGVAAAPAFIHEWDDADVVVGVWLPYSAQPAVAQLSAFDGANMMTARNEHRPWLEIAGLLAPGVGRADAAADLRRIQAGVPAPDRQRARPLDLSDGSRWASADADDAWGIYMAALILPLIVMLMTCVNAAALLLARAVGRQPEMALRRALGTTGAGLLRMLLTEHLVIAAIAGVASLALVYILPPVIVWQFDVAATFGDAATLRPDWRVFAAIGIAVLLAAVLSGLTPAREALRPQAGDSLLNRLGTLSRSRVRSRRLLVGMQLAACMVPLVVAMTFARSAGRYTGLGFWRGDLLVANVPSDRSRGVPLSAIADGISRVPGVDAVTSVDWLPVVFEGAERMRVPGQHLDIVAVRTSIGPGFFDVFDLPILAGESGRAAGRDTESGAIVVSSQFARRFFGEQNALGQVVEFPYDGPAGTRRIIAGIAGDRPVGSATLGGALMDGSAVYVPMSPDASGGTLVVRPAGPADAVRDVLATALRDLVGMPVPVTTYQARLDERVAVVRDVQQLLIVLGAVALALAVIAVAGSVAFDARQRRKEFAVQMALGASPWDVRRGVIRAGLRPVPISLALGLLASWVAVRGGLEYFRILPGGSMAAADPVPYVLVTVALGAVAVVTLLAIAWPVGRRDPLPALREE